jgi:5'-nucleotidase
MLAMSNLLGERRPDLVLSGINHGANMGDDVTYSGTVAAAMEATLLGVRAISVSQVAEEGRALSFACPDRLAPDLFRKLASAPWPENVLLNVNFPAVVPDAVTQVRVVPHGRRKLGDDLHERFDPRGRAYFWIGPQRSTEAAPEDTDIAVVEGGGIAVTPIFLDLTHYPSLSSFAEALR